MRISILLALVSSAVAAPTPHELQQNDLVIIPNKYIIKLKEDVTALAATDLKASFSNGFSHEYEMTTFRGFAGTFTAEEKAILEASGAVRRLLSPAYSHVHD